MKRENRNSKVDIVKQWRQKYQSAPVEEPQVVKAVSVPQKKKRITLKSLNTTKVSVDRLLSKVAAAGAGGGGSSRRDSTDDPRDVERAIASLSVFVSEDKLKLQIRTDDIQATTHRLEDGFSATSSLGDISVVSRQSSLGLGNGQMANRSYIVDSLLSNGSPTRSEKTIHEMLYEIEASAKANRPPPSYVPKLEDLEPGIVAWDGNSRGKKKKKKRKLSAGSLGSGATGSTAQSGIASRSGKLLTVKPVVEECDTRLRDHHQSVPMLDANQMRNAVSLSALEYADGDRPHEHSGSVNVNIIGCLKSVELVLAQAEQRSRKMKEIHLMKEKYCEDQRAQMEAMMQQKLNRAEKHAQQIAIRQRQIDWLRIMVMCCCMHRCRPFALMKQAGHTKRVRDVEDVKLNAAEIIYRNVCNWYTHLLYIKYRKGFLSMIARHRLKIELGLRIYRKRKATRRIKALLVACQGYQKLQMKHVVSNFLRSVRLIQRYIRMFLACKTARINILCTIWDKIEVPYIKRKLKEREELRNVSVSNKTFELPSEYISERSRIELKAQAKKWTVIDGKMEESLQKHRLLGNLKQTTTDDVINKLRAPEAARMPHIKRMLEIKRKEYILKREADRKAYISKISVFSSEDAINLIRGKANIVDRIINKSNMKVPIAPRNSDPFLLYSKLNHQLVFNRIKKTHDELETFVIKLEKGGNSKFAKRYAKIKHAHDSAPSMHRDSDEEDSDEGEGDVPLSSVGSPGKAVDDHHMHLHQHQHHGSNPRDHNPHRKLKALSVDDEDD